MFVLQNLRAGDRLQRARAEAFLLENPDPGVRARAPDQIERAIDTGLAVQINRDSQVCGLSLVYKYAAEEEVPVYSEIGTMRITANKLGFQTFIAKFHLIQLYLEEFFGNIGETFAVVSPNSVSDHNLRRNVGMQDWDPPSVLRVLRQAEGAAFSADKNVLRADLNVTRQAFDSFREWHVRSSVFRTPRGNEHVEIASGWFAPAALDHGP